MVGNFLKALFLDTSKKIAPTKLNSLNLKCITLSSIACDTLKIRKYYLQKLNVALGPSTSNNLYIKIIMLVLSVWNKIFLFIKSKIENESQHRGFPGGHPPKY